MQSQIDTLADRQDRLEHAMNDLSVSLKVALRLVRARVAGEVQALRDLEGRL